MTPKTFQLFLYVLGVFVILIHFQTVNADGKPTATVDAVQNNTNTNITGNCISPNCTTKQPTFFDNILNNKPMLMRAFYVLLAVSSIVVVYFLMRAWRLRRKRSKSRKYGLITAKGTDLEMAPLDQEDEDDEDMTVYEMNNKNSRKK